MMTDYIFKLNVKLLKGNCLDVLFSKVTELGLSPGHYDGDLK